MAIQQQDILVVRRQQNWISGRISAGIVTARRNPMGAAAFFGIVVFAFCAIFADKLVPYDPLASHSDNLLQPPNWDYLFGTDQFGRDLLSRILKGSQISMLVGVMSVAVGVTLGGFFGTISGYIGGRTDLIIQRIMDAWMALPSILLAMAIVAVLGPGLQNVILAIAIVSFPSINRVVRGSVMSEKESMYVEAARACGATPIRIMFRHLVPNVTAPIIVLATANLGGAVLVEASLSFLGLGIPKPNPTWGGMLSAEGRAYMIAAPWMAIFPGVALSLLVLCWNLLGDTLRDVWDPRLRGR